MDAKAFIEKYKNDIATKSGLYAIQNADFNRANGFVKVGKSTHFKSRFVGRQGSSYSTAYPTGFQVRYIISVPEHVSQFGPTQNKSRLDRREKQLMQFLDEAGIPRAFTRARGKPEWFNPSSPDAIYEQGFKKLWESTKEASSVWKCDTDGCKRVHHRAYGKVHDDPKLKRYNLRSRPGAVTRSQSARGRG